jgi:hypothetical protein
MVELPWEYRWSSCRAYARGEPDPLLSANPRYLELSPEPSQRQALWREFLLGPEAKELLIRQEDWVLGDDDFRRRAAIAKGWPLGRNRGRPRKQEAERRGK